MAFPIRDFHPITCNWLIRCHRLWAECPCPALNWEIYCSVSLTLMEEALTSGLNFCSRDRKGKWRGRKMPSENEVSNLMRAFKLICSSSSCRGAFKWFLYLRLQMAIDIFGMNKTDNYRIFPLFNLYMNAKFSCFVFFVCRNTNTLQWYYLTLA